MCVPADSWCAVRQIMAGANGATTNVDTAPDADSLAVSQGPFARPLEFLSVSPASRKNLHALFQQEQQEQAKWIDDAVDALAKRSKWVEGWEWCTVWVCALITTLWQTNSKAKLRCRRTCFNDRQKYTSVA